MPSQTNCLRYWDLSSQIRLDDAIALWCNVDPAELGRLGFDTQCMSAKRAALVTALREGRLEYEDLGLVTARGEVFKGAPLDELLAKDRLLIDKASLRRWFEQLPFEDRPAFLFDEALLDRKTTAAGLGYTVGWLEWVATQGGGPVLTKIGRSVRYRKADVLAWLDANSRRIHSTAELADRSGV